MQKAIHTIWLANVLTLGLIAAAQADAECEAYIDVEIGATSSVHRFCNFIAILA